MKDNMKFINDAIQAATNDQELQVNEKDSSDTVEKWDSLVTVNLSMAIASEFNIDLDIDELEQLNSVKGILDILEKNGF